MRLVAMVLTVMSLVACHMEDSVVKVAESPSGANSNDNSSGDAQPQTPFTEVEDTDQLPEIAAYQKILDKYAQDPTDLIELFDQKASSSFGYVVDVLNEYKQHLRNELNNMEGVSNEDGKWIIEFPKNEEGRARQARFRKLADQLNTTIRDGNKLAKIALENARRTLDNKKRQDKELAEKIAETKKNLAEVKQDVGELRERNNELVMDLAESIRNWNKSFGEAVDRYKANLDDFSCTIGDCATNETEKGERAREASEKLTKLLNFMEAVTGAEVSNGLQGIDVKGWASLIFAQRPGEVRSVITLDSEQLNSDSQVTLFIGDDKLPISLPANELHFEVNPTDGTIVARDNTQNTLATGKLSLTGDSRVGLEVRNTRINKLKVSL